MKTYLKIILSISSGLFLSLSLIELGFFAWFSLVPFFLVIYNSNLRQSLFYSFICGIVFFIGVTFWITEVVIGPWIIILMILNTYFLIFGTVTYYIFSKISLPYLRIFLIPSIWIMIEFVRSQTFLAFPIGIIGYSQHNFLPLMQITKFSGIYGVSFIIILFNLTLFETIIYFVKNNKVSFKYLPASIAILLVFVVFGITSVNSNSHRVIREKNFPEIKLAIVQPNIPLGEKYAKGSVIKIPEPFSSNRYFQEGTDMVMFPESIIWGSIEENNVFKGWAKKTLEKENLYLIMGQITHDEEYKKFYNSVLLYNSNLEIIGKYDEIHPIPFAQYMPYPNILKFLNFLNFSEVNLIAGNDYTPFNYPGKGKLGINICFESVLPLISRTFRNNGAEAILIFADDVALNDSIAAWYHFISSKVRAIENGCYVAHCGNVGISGIISPSGEILVKSDLLSRGVLYGSIFLISEKTFYSKYWNLLMYIYFGLTFISTFIYLIYKRRRK